MDRDHRKIEWYEIEYCVDRIARQVTEYQATVTWPIRMILAVTRGGLIPAGMLSYRLGLKDVRTVMPHNRTRRESLLVVDDISDTGRTLTGLSLRGLTAALYVRKGTITVPDFFGVEIVHDDWLDFPWNQFSDRPIGGISAATRNDGQKAKA